MRVGEEKRINDSRDERMTGYCTGERKSDKEGRGRSNISTQCKRVTVLRRCIAHQNPLIGPVLLLSDEHFVRVP
jgi:hypothetical protein